MNKIIQIVSSTDEDNGENLYALTEDGKVYMRAYETQKEYREYGERKPDGEPLYHKVKAYWKEVLEEEIY